MAALTEMSRRKAVGGILDRMRKEGMPASPVPGGIEPPEMQTAMEGEAESLDPDEPGIPQAERERRLRARKQPGRMAPFPGAY